MTQETIASIEHQIALLEVLLDDLSEFTKGCTDREQEKISPALHIIMDAIAKENQKLEQLNK